MIGFIGFWIRRFIDGNGPSVVGEPYQTIAYLAKTGWKPDYNFLKTGSNKQRSKYLKCLNAKGVDTHGNQER